MKVFSFIAAAGAAAVVFAGQTALGQVTLRYRYEPGQSRTYTRTAKTETQVRVASDTRRTVTEMAVQHQEIVLEARAEPAGGKVLIFDTPGAERLTAFEENGRDRLADVPEQNRSHPLVPVLAAQWRDPLGQTPDRPTKIEDPMAAIELVFAEMRALPEEAVHPGDSWTRKVDFGIAKATISGKFIDQHTEGGVSCAVLSTTAEVTFTGDFAKRLAIEKMTAQLTVAVDGSGWISNSGTAVILDKLDRGEQHITRTSQEKSTGAERVEPAQFDKAKADLARLEKAMDQVKADDLDGALVALETFIKENPQNPWTAAVQNLYNNVMQRRLLTKPVPPARLHLLLQELQTSRDRAATQGGAQQVAQVDGMIRQVATVNAKTILDESSDPDPIVRDLATFALSFIEGDAAATRLAANVKDASPQVRGTAAIGLALRGQAVEPAVLVNLLKDADARAQGCAALLAARTLKKEDPQAAQVLPLLLENLKSPNAWTRMNTAGAIAMLSPAGSVASAAALAAAYAAEKEQGLQPLYLQALKAITGIDSKEVGPYQEWLKRQGVVPAPGAPPAAPAAPTAPPAAPAPAPATPIPAPAAPK
jgi:hypothetical protein